MLLIEQRIRAILFYLSLFTFFLGLPFILSSALGYKFDPHTFIFTRAGLISLKTQPPGADVYLNGKLFSTDTPATISDLLPGQYNIRLELADHYPWIYDVKVAAGKVTYLDKIILFPLRSNIKHLNKEKVSSFWVDKERVYYFDRERLSIFRSDLEGEQFHEVAFLPQGFLEVKEFKVSPDRDKALLFNQRQIAVLYLDRQRYPGDNQDPVLLLYANRRINDVFWHSDGYHLVVVTEQNIEVIEAKTGAEAVDLVNLNKKHPLTFYEREKDELFFMDSQKAEDGKIYDNVYKLELGSKAPPFKDMMKNKADE